MGLIKQERQDGDSHLVNVFQPSFRERRTQEASFRDSNVRITGRRLWDLCMPHLNAHSRSAWIIFAILKAKAER